MSHPYPHFLIVGFMKAATTSVFDHIIEHPRVQAPLKKELHYFTRELDPLYDPAYYGLEYHEQLQYDPKSEKICGEASPSYIVASERIAAFNPNAKIIIMLRDPVDRALSQYRQYLEFQLTDNGAHLFDEGVEALNFVQDSLYESYVSQFLANFPPANVLLVSFEHFCASQQEAMRNIFRFLGLMPMAIAAEKKLSQTSAQVREGVREKLDAFFESRRGRIVPLINQYSPVTYPAQIEAFQRY
jgi:Sulfotransferase family